MKVKIYKSIAQGEVSAPPSKSMAHRALICAALGGGKIYNVALSKDITATLNCLGALGAEIEKNSDYIRIGGLDIKNIPENALLDCIESGSTLRFLLPLCMLTGKNIKLSGSPRLLSRPLSVYEDICKRDDIRFSNNGKEISVCGKLKGGVYTVPGDISSQFISGLLFALPLCDKDSKIEVTGAFESASYIDLTLSVMKEFGIDITREDNVFFIKGNSSYKNCDYTVEGDCSNAAFLDGFNLLGGNVAVTGLKADTLQGDRVYKDMLNALDTQTNNVFDLSDCPDLGPLMFALAAAKSDAKFLGTKRLKIKESDRVEAMRTELKKFGIDLLVEENSVTVCGGELCTPSEILYGHNDHRIVMALSLLCTLTGGVIDGAEAVEKSFPDFFLKLKSLSIGLENL